MKKGSLYIKYKKEPFFVQQQFPEEHLSLKQ